jgi:ecdysteroid 25-hydroxylase
MKFLLTGIAETHKVYDGIANKCEETLDSSECRDSILKRFLLEKRDREMRNDKLAAFCSRKQLNYLLADLFGASLDTTLCTLRWYLLMIALHKDEQDKVYEEMNNYGLRQQFLLDDIEHLNYLKASIAESQRLNGVVPCGIPHGNPTQSTTLGGFFIPKNTMVGLRCKLKKFFIDKLKNLRFYRCCMLFTWMRVLGRARKPLIPIDL